MSTAKKKVSTAYKKVDKKLGGRLPGGVAPKKATTTKTVTSKKPTYASWSGFRQVKQKAAAKPAPKPVTTTKTTTTKTTATKPATYATVAGFRQAEQQQLKGTTPEAIRQQSLTKLKYATPAGFREIEQKTMPRTSSSRSSSSSSRSSLARTIEQSKAYRVLVGDPKQYPLSRLTKDILTFSAMLPGAGALTKGAGSVVRAATSRVVPRVSSTVVGRTVSGAAQRVLPRVTGTVEQAARTATGTVGQAARTGVGRVATAIGAGAGRLATGARAIGQAARTGAGAVGRYVVQHPSVPIVAGVGGAIAYGMRTPGEAPTGVVPERTTAAPTAVSKADQESLARPPINYGYGGGGGYGYNIMSAAAGGQAGGGGQAVNSAPAGGGMTFDQLGQGAQSTVQQPPAAQTDVQPPEAAQIDVQPPDWNQLLQDVYALIDQAGERNAALVTTWLDQMTSTLDNLQSQITQMYQQQGTTLDPATLAALQRIRDQVAQRRQQLMEEMNRRGLLQSGIWLEEENRILNNQLTAEEQLLAGRLADIQSRLTDSMMEFAKQRLNIMGTLSQNIMENARWMGEQKITALQDITQRKQQWDQWWAEQQRLAREAQQEQNRWQYEQNQQQRQWEAEQQLEREKFGLDVQKAQQQNALGWARLQQSLNKTSTNSATRQYLQAIPSYGSLQEALNAYNQFKGDMLAQGADVAEILRNIYAYFGS